MSIVPRGVRGSIAAGWCRSAWGWGVEVEGGEAECFGSSPRRELCAGTGRLEGSFSISNTVNPNTFSFILLILCLTELSLHRR